jgi:hypothetical protein
VYAAGLERRVTPPPGEQAIVVIADHVLAHGSEVDGIIQTISSLREPLDRWSMESIVEQHGRLTSLLQRVATDGRAPRSFASKYLHFHHPVVPIYDEYARQALSRLVRWDRSNLPFPLPSGGDQEYWDYCIRFFRLYNACRQAGTRATVKALDVTCGRCQSQAAGPPRRRKQTRSGEGPQSVAGVVTFEWSSD